MPLATVAGLVDALCRAHLLDAPQQAELTGALQTRFPKPNALVGEF